MKTEFKGTWRNEPRLVINWERLFTVVFIIACYLFIGWVVKLISGWDYKDSLIIALLISMALDIAFIRVKGVRNE